MFYALILQLHKPEDETYTDFWVDFNCGSKRMTLFCDQDLAEDSMVSILCTQKVKKTCWFLYFDIKESRYSIFNSLSFVVG